MKPKKYAPIILRIGLSLVFIWFGLTNTFNPESFLGYLPEYSLSLPIQPTTLLFLNGIFELVFGTLLLLGIFTRTSSFLLTLHLLSITIGLGYNDIAIRDLGLTIATLTIFLHGKDKWCLDNKFTNST